MGAAFTEKSNVVLTGKEPFTLDVTGAAKFTNALAVSYGGSGATSLTGYLKGNGTSAFTGISTIPGTDVSGNITGNAANVTGVVAVTNGGSGATSLTGYVKGNGTSAFTGSATIPGSDVSGNITGNAANVTGTVAVANGGTGATTLTGYVKGAGTSAMTASATIPGSDISGNISGNAANVTGTVAVANGGTGATTLTGYLKGNGTSTFTGSATIPGSDVSGNISGNATNVTGTVAVANGGTGTATGSITGTGALTFTAGGTNTNVTLAPNGTGTVDVSSKRITSLATPTQDTDAATKGYVDAVKQGLDVKDSVRVATTANITLSGTQTIDGVSVVAGNRVLVKNQSTASQNGIYVVAAGSWSRATDADSSDEVTAGMFTFVSEGTTNGDTGWILTTNDAITIGTTGLSFTQFSGAGSIEAGDGLTKTGNQIDVVGTADRIVVNADSVDIASTYAGQTTITTLGTVSTGTWQGSFVDVSYGGTGATNAAAARMNLSVPHSYSMISSGRFSIVATPGGANSASADWSAVLAGTNNTSSGNYSTVAGGRSNASSGTDSTVGGGFSNRSSGLYSTVGGGKSNVSSGKYGFIGSGEGNNASGLYSTVGGGRNNTSSGDNSTVGGGRFNTSSAYFSTVGGGSGNASSGLYSTVGGGSGNTSSGSNSTVGGGRYNTSSNYASTVGGGRNNISSANFSTVGGGKFNTASGTYATIPGGNANTATHNNVFLLGSSLVSDANDTTYVENLRVKGGFNTGVDLGTNAFPTGKISIRSAIVNLKTVAETTIFTVPTGYMFLIDTMEVVTTSVTSAGAAPTIQFGNTGDSDAYYGPTQITSNAVGARHIVENPQDGAAAGTAVTIGVTVASTATAHSGVGIVTGYLLKTS